MNILFIIIPFAIVIGIPIGIVIGRLLSKRNIKKAEGTAVKKIMEQDKEFKIDGKDYDLKEEIEKQINKNE